MSKKQVCCVCLKDDSVLYTLSELVAINSEGNQISLLEMLAFCCSVELDEEQTLLICSACSDACAKAYDFIKLFQKNNLGFKFVKKEPIKNTTDEIEEIKIEIISEPGDDVHLNEDSELNFMVCETEQSSQDFNIGEYTENKPAKDDLDEHKCPICSETFVLYSALISHVKVHPHEDFKCHLCSKVCKDTVDFEVHYFKDHYSFCTVCNQTFLVREDFVNHMRIVHNKLLKPTISVKNDSKPNQNNSHLHKCPLCNFSSKFHVNLTRHIKNHKNEGFPCNLCDDYCADSTEFEKHYLQMHYNFCSICNIYFQSRDSYKKHKLMKHTKVLKKRIVSQSEPNQNKSQINQKSKNTDKETDHSILMNSFADSRKHKCPICNQKYAIYKFFVDHISAHQDEEFLCHFCGEQCPNPDEFEKHYFNAHYNFCSICDIGFSTREKFKNHKAVMHRDLIKPRKFCRLKRTCHKCPLCIHEVRHLPRLLKHMLESHPVQSIECEICNDVFSTHEEYYKHYGHKHNISYCDICDMSFDSRHTFNIHQRIHKQQPCFGYGQIHKCPICANEIESFAAFWKHMEEHKDIIVECSICNGVLVNIETYLKHYQSEHRIKCNRCGVYFTTQKQFDKHINKNYVPKDTESKVEQRKVIPKKKKINTRDNPSKIKPNVKLRQHICPICNEDIPRIRMFRTHIVSHLEECDNEMACICCDKICLNAGDFYNHYTSQHYIHCKKCYLYFLSPEMFEDHECRPRKLQLTKSHIKAKKNFCQTCGKHYTGSLKYHEQVHQNKFVYKCDMCGEIFTNYGKWRYHRQTKHNQMQQYLCTYCGRRFVQKSHLVIHLQTHTGVKLYSCPKCGQKFSTAASRKKHIAKNLCGVGRGRKRRNVEEFELLNKVEDIEKFEDADQVEEYYDL